MHFKLLKQSILLISLITISISSFAENFIQPFISGSYSQILAERQNKPFVLILWSLDCPSCYKELEMLGEFSKKHTELDIVLISTDIEATYDEVQAVLSMYKLEQIESWLFRGESDESLRFEIDPAWYGELPRSYMIKTATKRQVVSGMIAEEKLLAWMKD